jgi:hypothetical protein
MTSLRHLDYITNLPSPSNQKHKFHKMIISFMTLAMKYEHSDKPLNDVLKDEKKTMSNFYKFLKDKFFEKLYVERRELSDILDWLNTRWATMVTGHIGSGKTTLLLKLYNDLKENNDFLPFYFDLFNLYSLLDPIDAQYPQISPPPLESELGNIILPDPAKVHADLCTIIETNLRLQCREKIPNLDSEYAVFKIRKHSSYSSLLNSILEIENPKNLEEWKNVLQNEKFKNWKIDIDKLKSSTPAHDLEIFLQFLKENFPNKKPVIILDNIDRYSILFQREIYSKSIGLSRTELVKLVLAFRAHNLRVLRYEGEHGHVFHEANIELRLPGDVNCTALKSSTDIIKEFIKKRISLLKEMNLDIITREKFGEIYGKDLNLNYDEFYTYFWDLFDRAIEGSSSGELLGSYTHWCNGSLRNIAIHVTKYLSSILLGDDPFYSLDKIINPRGIQKINRRLIRSYIYKRMTCGDSLLFDSQSCFNAFNPLTSASPFLDFYFLEYKILRYLERKKGSCNYNTIIEDFSRCGISKLKIYESLIKLKTARSAAERGYIYIDKRESKIHLDMDGDTLIILLPSGEFFLETLSVSCEYVFWCALDINLNYIFSPFKQDSSVANISYSQLQDDVTRTRIVIEFIRDSLIPVFLKEIQSIIKDTSNSKYNYNLAEFMEKFCDDDKLWITRIIISIRKFISSDIDLSTRYKFYTILNQCEERITRLIEKHS